MRLGAEAFMSSGYLEEVRVCKTNKQTCATYANRARLSPVSGSPGDTRTTVMTQADQGTKIRLWQPKRHLS